MRGIGGTKLQRILRPIAACHMHHGGGEAFAILGLKPYLERCIKRAQALGVHPEAIDLALLYGHTGIIADVSDTSALPGAHDFEHHVIGIVRMSGIVELRVIFDLAAASFKLLPCPQGVVFRPIDRRIRKRAILNHFRIEPTICSVIQIFKKNTKKIAQRLPSAFAIYMQSYSVHIVPVLSPPEGGSIVQTV